MRLKWQTAVTDTRPLASMAGSGTAGVALQTSRPPVAELPADRFRIETADGVHRIYDDLSWHPLGGKPDPLVDALSKVAEQDRERVQRDRATVADQGLSMPARLAALARLQRRAQR